MRSIFFLFLFFSVHLIYGQQYQERAARNLPLLIRDSVLLDQVKIDDKGVSMYASADDKANDNPETTIYWNEVPAFLHLLSKGSFQKNVDRYLAKGTEAYGKTAGIMPPRPSTPKTMAGLRIALDPGHNANRFENAVLERKYMRIKGADLGMEKDVEFFEADLVYETALILKQRLEKAGAIVLMSRDRGESAHGSDFDTWLKRCKNRELRRDKRKKRMTKQQFRWYRDTATVAQLHRYFFNRKDLQARADKINAWKPDLTLNIHYNASGANPVDGYFIPTEKNYGMMFVGGGFMKGELKKPEYRLHFLRLLLSPDLERSIDFSAVLMQAHEEKLQVAAIPNDNDIFYLNDNSVYAGKHGVYARNLFLTRAIMGTICFGESFLQDNIEEAKRLVKEDYEEGGVVTSKRVAEVVEAFYLGLERYLAKYGSRR